MVLEQLRLYQLKHHTVAFWLGILGLVFYATTPAILPHNPEMRQPELLPVYTLMMGFGMTLKGNTTVETGGVTVESGAANDED